MLSSATELNLTYPLTKQKSNKKPTMVNRLQCCQTFPRIWPVECATIQQTNTNFQARKMKLHCLSERANRPCYVLTFKDVSLMLDCGLDMSPALHFMPIPLVHSIKLSQLMRVTSKEKPALDGVSLMMTYLLAVRSLNF